jgi:DNA repair exonuclease SbcCD ATPase subunit
MEMELKLMKEREREIAKSGGFTQLFNDDKDPSIHIQQLKVKYANMRKKMEDEILLLNDKKREIIGINVALKAKLNSVQKFEQDVYNKLKELEREKKTILNEKNSQFFEKDNERTNLEADNKLSNTTLNQTLKENEDLKYKIETDEKIGKMSQEDFNEKVKLVEDLIEIKGKELNDCRDEIKVIIEKAESVPNYKEEQENNEKYKKEIEELKEKNLKLQTEAESAEMVNNYLIKKKNDVIAERKKYIDLNIELKHEIEAKTTLNNNRIQKKVREANSEEIQEITAKLEETKQKVNDLEDKIKKEIEKVHNFTKEIIKVNIKLNHRKEIEENLQKNIAKEKEELEQNKKTYEVCEEESDTLKDKIGKEKTDNELLKNRNKLLHEENSAITSKFDFIKDNYDYTTNLKRISMEDLKNLAQSNTLVNATIDNFVDKVGTFKQNNVQSLLFDDNI